MSKRLPFAAALLVCVFAGTAQAGGCSGCHPSETAAYGRSRMASAAVPVLQSAFAQNAPGQVLRESGDGYQFVYKQTATGLAVASFRGTESAVGQVAWVLGSGAQGQTPIVRSGDTFFESRVSFFPEIGRFGITVGQPATASSSAFAALGRAKTKEELSQCLACHLTALDSSFTKVELGVQCENCHPGAQAHAEGKGKPVNPGRGTAAAQVQLCGNCHRNAPPVGDGELENVRFQPLRLSKSRCFVSGDIRCTTCHVAHQDARRADPAFYNAKCADCHAGGKAAAKHMDARAQGNCISCHMPQVQLHQALRFTDHDIRVVRTGDYPAGRVVARAGD